MTELVKTERRDLSEMTLDELGAAANREFRMASDKANEVVNHMRIAGEYLWEIKQRLPQKAAFDGWVVNHWDSSVSHVNMCIRVAHYWDRIVEARATNTNQARIALLGLPPVRGNYQSNRARRYSDEDQELARSMRDDGYTYGEIAAAIGCTQTTAILWVDPEFQKRQRELSRRRSREFHERHRQKKKERRLREIAKRKDPVSDAYSMIRKLTQLVDQGRAEVHDQEGKEALRRAESLLHQADAAIVKALGLK